MLTWLITGANLVEKIQGGGTTLVWNKALCQLICFNSLKNDLYDNKWALFIVIHFKQINADLSEIQTPIVVVEGKDADHKTSGQPLEKLANTLN